ncbi:hypothetical protein GGI25_001976 [Coemansia spiralis]|uniref:WAC domain-containing protein n=2 Tax=Coemansia TaxID=4863 RepID=A0A9W8G9S9_9FUNG|nr:hypothetical protein EDC05_006272 [Coemansia umbellata]KAJ2623443.1 hypothetical protein GGI26_002282 [Coemansia sp. RSA 1358]KAJ2678987.1 hypothetical protein GGI25_001976 [Coemansia spiralis]
MPLLNGQPVELVSQTDNASNSRTQAWEIRFTGEIFTDYDKYLDRMAQYRKPVWTCKESGQSNLTYEQAMLSERALQHRATGIGFSDMLICEMLTFLSQSSLPIAQAIDALYYRFQLDFFIGEHIDVKYPGTDGAMYECLVVGVHPLPQPPVLGTFAADGSAVITKHEVQTPTQVAIERLGDGADRIVAYEQRKARMYSVRLYDVDGNPIEDSDITIPATELSRSRNVFTKVALRQFLDEHMRREARPGSPWIVLPQWRDRFRIPYMFGGEACMMRPSKPATRRLSSAFSGNRDFEAAKSKQQLLSPWTESPYDNAGIYPADSDLLFFQETKKSHRNVASDPYADERDPTLKPIKKFPADDLEFVNYQHVKWNEGIVWALRRKQQKLSGAATNPEQSKKTNGKSNGRSNRQITEFFAVSSAKDQEANEVSQQEEQTEGQKEEEEEEEALQNRWPVPLCAWQIPAFLVSRTLSAYMFVSIFSASIKLNTYSLDFFESALVHGLPSTSSSDKQSGYVCSVYRDTVIALLNSIIEDRQNNMLPNNVSSRIESMVEYQDENASEPEDEAKAKAATNEMSVDNDNTRAESKMHVGAKTDAELPPTAPRLGSNDKAAKSQSAALLPRKNHRSLKARIGRSRLQQSMSITNEPDALSSYSSVSSNSEDESEASTATTGTSSRTTRKQRNGRHSLKKTAAVALARGKGRKLRSRESAASSRAATPAVTDDESATESNITSADEGDSVDRKALQDHDESNLSSLCSHDLLRQISRMWAKNGIDSSREGWVWRLVGWINEACYDYNELTPIYDLLWNNMEMKLTNLEETLWNGIDLEQRLIILELLIAECANNQSVREYIDQCAEATAELKRERVELRRELKRTSETLAELDKEEAQENGDNVAFSREQGRKEKEQGVQRQKERRKLGESERQLNRRLDYLEREIRRNNVSRLTPLGSDRYFNKYYFIDGIGGSMIAGGSGRIFVQPASTQEQAAALYGQPRIVFDSWALEMPALWNASLEFRGREKELLSLSFPSEQDRKPNNAMVELCRQGELWGYYATTSQIDELKRWLDARGKREAALIAELDLLQITIAGSIRKRCHTLERSFNARVRAREHICEQISACLDDVPAESSLDKKTSRDEILAKLHDELSQMDRTPVAPALLPPSMLIEQQQQRPGNVAKDGDIDDSSVLTPVHVQNGIDSSNLNSSRASSVEPASSIDLFAQQASLLASSKRQNALKPMRGRRPKNRNSNRFRTFIDDFVDYENTLLS